MKDSPETRTKKRGPYIVEQTKADFMPTTRRHIPPPASLYIDDLIHQVGRSTSHLPSYFLFLSIFPTLFLSCVHRSVYI